MFILCFWLAVSLPFSDNGLAVKLTSLHVLNVQVQLLLSIFIRQIIYTLEFIQFKYI